MCNKSKSIKGIIKHWSICFVAAAIISTLLAFVLILIDKHETLKIAYRHQLYLTDSLFHVIGDPGGLHVFTKP